MIIAKTDSEIQVLTYSPGIDSAETIQVTLFDGTAVTVADLIGGTGKFLVFNDPDDGTLQLMSRTTV